ncbi:MarR family winged helix-turn-helix transcriptional regulator [Methylobacterium sp. CM6241]|uniref:MarR family winged helix-turn-helix transcriptional regulator n=1 Tax=Methylobacterium sp. 88A TaxID=1131813 RepID=UPI0003769D10|nr:MarR family transcriptional regulator [Methylobacterium sp. 88A]
MDLSDLSQAYSHTLILTGRQWRRVANTVTERHGISEAKALPLVMIARMGDAPRQNALAEAVGIEGPSLVRLLDQLEKAGLVVRTEDPSDRRAKVLSLTSEAKMVVAEIEVELAGLRAAMFADVSPADLEASLRVFRTVQDFAAGASAAAAATKDAPE